MRRSAREESELTDFGPNPRVERRQRRIVERLVHRVADVFEPPLTDEERKKLKEREEP